MENKNIHTYKICFQLGKKDFIISTKCRIKAQSSTTGACPALFKHQKLLKMQLQAQWSILEYVYPKKHEQRNTELMWNALGTRISGSGAPNSFFSRAWPHVCRQLQLPMPWAVMRNVTLILALMLLLHPPTLSLVLPPIFRAQISIFIQPALFPAKLLQIIPRLMRPGRTKLLWSSSSTLDPGRELTNLGE